MFSQAVEEAAGDHRPMGRTEFWETPEGQLPQLPSGIDGVTPQQLQQQLQMVRPFLVLAFRSPGVYAQTNCL